MKYIKGILIFTFSVIVLIGTYVLGVNFYVIFSQNSNVIALDEVAELKNVDYIIVLGCGLNNGKPSDMLEDRLLMALEVAARLPDAKLLLSGDNDGPYYNEPAAMKEYCIEQGFDERKIVSDDFGFSTGDSITNLYTTFQGEKVVIVTQKYHLYRALHIAQRYGIESYGVASNQRRYAMQIYYSLREIAARNKDFLKYIKV